jgi:hypothetical protein
VVASLEREEDWVPAYEDDLVVEMKKIRLVLVVLKIRLGWSEKVGLEQRSKSCGVLCDPFSFHRLFASYFSPFDPVSLVLQRLWCRMIRSFLTRLARLRTWLALEHEPFLFQHRHRIALLALADRANNSFV